MIEFYSKETGRALDNTSDMFFIRGNGDVWRDTGDMWESQQSVIGFEDCVEHCPVYSWRVMPNVQIEGLADTALNKGDAP